MNEIVRLYTTWTLKSVKNYSIQFIWLSYLRYNFITGLYPFEGDNIYKLYENIGKGVYSIPNDVDKSLESLLRGMLSKDIEERFSLQQIKRHPWTIARTLRNYEEVPIPPLRGDEWHTMTVLPYLMEHHYGVDNDPTYYTEHELNGRVIFSWTCLHLDS